MKIVVKMYTGVLRKKLWMVHQHYIIENAMDIATMRKEILLL